MIKRMTETGNITLNANVLKINTTGGKKKKKTIETEDELRNALEAHYGIKVDFPLKMD
jgi:arylamine N-acetyltransferase